MIRIAVYIPRYTEIGMVQATSKTFKSGNSVAVRLPKELAFEPGVELLINRSGDMVTMVPKSRAAVVELVRRLREIGPPPDGVQARDPIDFPSRPGL